MLNLPLTQSFVMGIGGVGRNIENFGVKPTGTHVLLVDIDGSTDYPNLALMKLSAWHKRRGDRVTLYKIETRKSKSLHKQRLRELKDLEKSFWEPLIDHDELERLREFYEAAPGTLIDDPSLSDLDQIDYDVMYASCVFTRNNSAARELLEYFPDAIVGGTGLDEYFEAEAGKRAQPKIITKLPSEVENMYPDFDLYGITFGMGFLSRGCIRKCTFCVVPVKEGGLLPMYWGLAGVINWELPEGVHPTMHEITEMFARGELKARDHVFNDRKGRKPKVKPFVTLMDNNFFGDPNCVDYMKAMIEMDIAVNFNQGLDIRLLSTKARTVDGVEYPSGEEIAEHLSRVDFWNLRGSERMLHFAWDYVGIERLVRQGFEILAKYGIKGRQVMVYTLIGFNSTHEQDMYRVAVIREYDALPYIMLFRNTDGHEGTMFDGSPQDWRSRHVVRYVNNIILFKSLLRAAGGNVYLALENYDVYAKEKKMRDEEDEKSKLARIVARDEYNLFNWLEKQYVEAS